jgi:hypothetical protein
MQNSSTDSKPSCFSKRAENCKKIITKTKNWFSFRSFKSDNSLTNANQLLRVQTAEESSQNTVANKKPISI